MQCYVCLESCSTRSPCECESAIHPSCWLQMQRKMPHENCTVCKSPLQIEPVSFPAEMPESVLIIPDDDDDHSTLCPILSFIVFVCSMYLICGYFGKAILIFGGTKIDNFWEFWSYTHVVCSFFTSGLSFIFWRQR